MEKNRDRDGASSTNGSGSWEARLRLERMPSTSFVLVLRYSLPKFRK